MSASEPCRPGCECPHCIYERDRPQAENQVQHSIHVRLPLDVARHLQAQAEYLGCPPGELAARILEKRAAEPLVTASPVNDLDHDVIRRLHADLDWFRNERQHTTDTLEALQAEIERWREQNQANHLEIRRLHGEIDRLRAGGAYQAGYDAGKADGYNDGRSDSMTDELDQARKDLELATAGRDYWRARTDAWVGVARRRSLEIERLQSVIDRANLALASGDLLSARDVLDEAYQ